MELSLSVDNLSTAEQHQIWEVLQRDQALQNKQYSKINELKNEIQDIRMKGILRDGDDSSRLCARCHSPLGVIFNKGEVCPNCRFKMCKNCRVALFSGGWTCIFCFKNMQLKWLSGDWTHGKLRPRGLTRRASGSDLIRSVLVKSVTPAPGNAGKAVTEEIRRAITNGSVPPPDELERDSSQENSPVGGSTLHDTDVERVGFPSEADSFRLSRLIGSYGGGNPSEEKERVCVKRVSSRPYRDSDSDSSSSIATSPTLSAAKKSGNISTSSLSTQDKTIEGDVGVEQNGHKKLSPVSNFAQEKQPSNNVAGSSSNSNEIEQSSPKFSSPGLSLQVDSKPRLLDLAKSNPSSPKNMSQSIDGSHSALTTQNISASIDSGKIPTSYQADAGSEQELFPLSPSSVSRNIPSSDGSDNEQPIDSYFVTDLASKDDISQTKKTEIESVKPLGLVDKEDGDVLTFTGEKQQVHSDQFGESDKSKHSTMSVQKESDSLFSANRGDVKISPGKTLDITMKKTEESYLNEIPEGKVHSIQKPRFPFQSTPSADSSRKMFEQSPFTEDDKATKMIKQPSKQTVDLHNNEVEEEKVGFVQKSRFPSNVNMPSQLPTKIFYDKEDKDHKEELVTPKITSTHETKRKVVKEYQQADEQARSDLKDPSTKLSTKVLHDTDSKDKFLKKPVKDTSEEKFGVADKNVLLAPSIPSSGDSQHSDKSSSQNIGGKITNKQPPKEDDSFNPFDKYYRIKKDIKISPSNTDGSEKVSTVNLEKPTDGEMPEEKLEATDKPRLPFQASPSVLSYKRKIFEQSPFTEDDDKARKMVKQLPKQNNKIEEEKVAVIQKSRFPSIKKSNQLSTDRESKDDAQDKKAVPQISKLDKPKDELTDKKSYSLSKDPVLHDTDSKDKILKKPVKDTSEEKFGVADKNVLLAPSIPSSGDSQHSDKSSSQNIGGKITNKQPPREDDSFNPFDKYYRIKKDIKISPSNTDVSEKVSTVNLEKPTDGEMSEEKLKATDKPRLPFQNASSFVNSRIKMFEKSPLTEDDDKARKMMKQAPKQTDNKKVVEDEIGTTIKPKFPSGISSPNWSSVKKANEKIGKNLKATTPVKTRDTPDNTDFIDRSELKIQIQEKQRIVFSRKKPSDSVSRNFLERNIKDSSGERDSTCTPAKSSSEQVKDVKKKKNSQIEIVPVAGKSRFPFRGEAPHHHLSKDTSENQVADVKDVMSKQISESRETENNRSGQVSDKDHTIQHKPQTDFYKTNIQDFHSDSGIQYPNSQKDPTFLSTKPKSVHLVDNSKSPIQDKKEVISSVKESQLDSFSHKDKISPSLPSPSNNTNQVSSIRSEQKGVSDPEKYNNDKLGLLSAASDGRKVPIHPDLISSTNDWIDHKETKLPFSSRETIKRSKPKTSNSSGNILSVGHVVPSDVRPQLASKPVTDKPTASSSLSKPITAAQTSQQTSLNWIDRKETFFSAERTKATRRKHKSEKDESDEKKSTSDDYKSFPEKYPENRPGRVDQSPSSRHSQSDNKVKKFSSSNYSEVKEVGICEAKQKSGLITPPVKEITCKAPLKINIDYKSETAVDCPKDVVSTPHCESDKSTANISNVHDEQTDKKNIPSYENVGVFSEPDMKMNLENETSGTKSADKHVANLASQKTKDGPDEKISSDKLVTNKTPPKSKETTFGPDIKEPDDKHVAEVTSSKSRETTFGPDTKVSADRHVANLASPKTKETTFGPDEDISENRHVANLVSPKSKETTFGSEENIPAVKQFAKMTIPETKESDEKIFAVKLDANLNSPKTKETTFGPDEKTQDDKHVVNVASPKTKQTTFGPEEDISVVKQLGKMTLPKTKESTFSPDKNISADKHVENLASPKSKETTFGSEENITADKHVAKLASPKRRETTFGSEDNISADKHVAKLASPKSKETTFGSEENISNYKHVAKLASPKRRETTFGSEENISADKHVAKLASPKRRETTFRSEENISGDKHGAKLASPKRRETTFGSEENISADKHVAKLASPKRRETTFGSEENISTDKHVAKLASPKSKQTTFGSEENISVVKQLAKMTLPKTKESTFSPDKNISADKHVAHLVSPKTKQTTFGSEENMSADKHVANLVSPKSKETTFGSEENISADKHVTNLASPRSKEKTFGSEENISADKHVADLASPKSKETTFGLEENISADKHVADLASPKRRETTFGSEENISADKHVADLASPKSKETTFGSEENISADKHVANLVFPKSKETAFDSEENISADKHVANLASPKSKETTFGSEENISADKHVANLASPKPKETTFGSEENISADKHVANLASPKSKETTFGSEENISADKHVANLASPKSKETTFGSEENISADTHVANLFSLKSKKAVGSEVSVSADNEILPKTTVLLSNRKLDNNEAVSSDHPEELAQDKAKKRIGSRPKQENRVSASRTLPTITRYVSSLQSERTPPSIKSPTELDKPSSSSLDVHSTMTSGKLELSIDDKKENSDTTLVLSKPEDEAVYWIDRKENTFSPNCKASLKKKKPVISQSFEEKLSSGFGLQHKPLSATSISFGNEVSQSKNESEAVNLNSVSEDALSSSKVIPRFSSWIGFKKNDSTPESVGSASIKHNQKQYSMPMKEDKKLDVKDLAQTNNTIKQFNDVVGVNRPLPPAPSMTTDVSEPLLDCWVERKESFLSDSKANSGHWIYTHTRPQLFAKNDNNIETSGRSEKSNEFVNYESSYGNEPETPNTADFPIKENKLQQKSIEDTYLNKKAASEYGLDSVNSNEDVYPLEEEGIKLKVELEFNQGVSRTDTQAPEDQSFTFVKEYTSVEPNSSQSEKFRKPSQSDSNNKDLSKMPESGVYFVEMNSDDGEESNISGYPVEYNNGIISYSSYPKQQNLSSEPYAESDPSKQSSSDHYEPQKPTMKLRQSQKNYSPHFTESVNETEIDSHFENNSEADMLSKWNDTNSPVKAKSITSDFSPRERNYQDTPSFSESCSSRSHPVREMSPIANLRDMVLNDEKLAYQQFLNKPSGNYKNLKQSPENQYSSKALNYRLYEDDNIFKPTELSDAFEYTSSTSEMLPNPAAPNRNKTKYNTQPSHKFVQSDLTDSSQQYVNTDSSDFVVDSGRHL